MYIYTHLLLYIYTYAHIFQRMKRNSHGHSACSGHDYFSSFFEICVHMCIYIVISVYICTYSAISKNGDIICHNWYWNSSLLQLLICKNCGGQCWYYALTGFSFTFLSRNRKKSCSSHNLLWNLLKKLIKINFL